MKKQLLVVTILAPLVFGQAYAGNNLLEQGASLFNAFSGKKQTTNNQASGMDLGSLSLGDISQGLKEALEIGSQKVVKQLGSTDGFNNDSLIHIPLPGNLAKAQSLLRQAGLSGLADDLEMRLNRAAEAAVSQAQPLFTRAISEMTFQDAQAIWQGGDNAATLYFKEKMTPDLSRAMRPIVDKALTDVQALQIYNAIKAKYSAIPFAPNINVDLNEYVVTKGMDGIFYYIAQEEKAIRQNPMKRTTELLQRVFR